MNKELPIDIIINIFNIRCDQINEDIDDIISILNDIFFLTNHLSITKVISKYSFNHEYTIKLDKLYYNCDEYLYSIIVYGNCIFLHIDTLNGCLITHESDIITNPTYLDLFHYTNNYTTYDIYDICFEGASIITDFSTESYYVEEYIKDITYIKGLIEYL